MIIYILSDYILVLLISLRNERSDKEKTKERERDVHSFSNNVSHEQSKLLDQHNIYIKSKAQRKSVIILYCCFFRSVTTTNS